MNKALSLFLLITIVAIAYSGYRAIDSIASVFDGRYDVQIAEIETTGRVQVAVINAERDITITTIKAQENLGVSCIESNANAYRCINAAGVAGTGASSSLSDGQQWIMFLVGFVALAFVAIHINSMAPRGK